MSGRYLNKPAGKFADLNADAQAVMTVLLRKLVPKPPQLSDEEHLKAGVELLDKGWIWFQSDGERFVLRSVAQGHEPIERGERIA